MSALLILPFVIYVPGGGAFVFLVPFAAGMVVTAGGLLLYDFSHYRSD